MAADAALREQLVTRPQIGAQLDRAAGWPGVRAARDVLALADPRAESPLESLLRFQMHRDGLPAPVPQVWIDDPALGRRYLLDLLLEQAGLVLEADGRGKYTGDALWREKQREQRLNALGFSVERVVWDDVVRRWPATSARLRLRLLEAGLPPATTHHRDQRWVTSEGKRDDTEPRVHPTSGTAYYRDHQRVVSEGEPNPPARISRGCAASGCA